MTAEPLTEAQKRLRRQFTIIWACGMIVAVCVILAGLGLLAVKRESDRRQRDMCDIIALVNPTSPAPAPGRGQVVSDGLSRYQHRDCPASGK